MRGAWAWGYVGKNETMLVLPRFSVREISTLGTIAAPEIDAKFALSPFVWRVADGFRMLVRLVDRTDDPKKKVSRIFAGTSVDGIAFRIDATPALSPNPGTADAGGCEDPTVVAGGDGISVFYSGWDDATGEGTLLLASGPRIEALEKRGLVLAANASHRNLKEATLARTRSGDWVLFFEYAAEGASKIGLARASELAGPWTLDTDFAFPTRAGRWDSWHLSPGPIVALDSAPPTMFYNGGTREGAWRIGCVAFDDEFSHIVARDDEPLLEPPPPSGDDSDIAFAASAVVADDGTVDLYYTVADRFCKRATLALRSR